MTTIRKIKRAKNRIAILVENFKKILHRDALDQESISKIEEEIGLAAQDLQNSECLLYKMVAACNNGYVQNLLFNNDHCAFICESLHFAKLNFENYLNSLNGKEIPGFIFDAEYTDDRTYLQNVLKSLMWYGEHSCGLNKNEVEYQKNLIQSALQKSDKLKEIASMFLSNNERITTGITIKEVNSLFSVSQLLQKLLVHEIYTINQPKPFIYEKHSEDS